MQFYPIATHILLVDEFSTLVEAEGHDRSDIIGSSDDGCSDIRFFYMVYHRLVGQARRVVHLFHSSLLVIAHI